MTMSRRNTRPGKAGRHAQREHQHLEPPQRLQDLARQSACPDCNSEVVLLHRRGGDDWDWSMETRHDDECPQLQWRQRTGAGPSIAVVSKDGGPVPPELFTQIAQLLDENGLVPGRIAASADGTVPPAPSWQERELIEQAVRGMRGGSG
jgi:sulfur carrier protein ThiS